MDAPAHIDHLMAALSELERAADDNVARTREIKRRARHIQRRITAGDDLVPLIEQEDRPRMVELLSSNMAALETAGAEFRAAEARALREEGLTIEAIADLFGVTRQRISALLKQRAAQVS